MTRRLCAVVGLLILPAASTVDATTVRRLANEELAREAEIIVIGRAVSWETRWVDRTLYTMVTVDVSDTLKGAAEERLVVALPGGIDSQRKIPVSVTYPGAPTLGRDEEAVLFLVGARGLGAHRIAGFSQGKFSIVQDAGGVKRVSRDLTRVQVQDAQGVGHGTRTLAPLSDFLGEIRGYVGREQQ